MESQGAGILPPSGGPQWGFLGPYYYQLACLPHREVVLAQGLYDSVGTIPAEVWNAIASRLPPYAQGYLRSLLGSAPFVSNGSCYWV